MQAPSRARELLIALFVLGVALLTPPLLIVFNSPARVLGVPVLYLYLFAVWVVLIALVAVAVERGGDAEDLADAAAEARGSEPAQAGPQAGGATDA
jgi:Ca2+/Na+ antiporter